MSKDRPHKECHKCPYNGKKSSKCIDCGGPSEDPKNNWVSHVSFEKIKHTISGEVVDITDTPVEKPLLEFFSSWLSMKPRHRDAAAMMILNPSISMTDVSRRLGVTRQAIQKAVANISAGDSVMSHLRLSSRR